MFPLRGPAHVSGPVHIFGSTPLSRVELGLWAGEQPITLTRIGDRHGVSALTCELRRMCAENRTGSYATRHQRLDMLMLFADQLRAGGYKLAGMRSLKPKHVMYLLECWQRDDLSTGTIKNRMSVLRWWANHSGKPGMIPADNTELGIPERSRTGGDRAWTLDEDKLASIDDLRMVLSLKLMQAFGLRREEALKFRPRLADRVDYIALQPSWTKGRRYREIPIRTQAQRALLNEAAALVGGDSLIPNELSYIKHRKAFEYQTLKVGLTNLHGLRHGYAQRLYADLTGFACPISGGPATADLSSIERVRDRDARMTIAQELGHGRRDVTKAYLG